MADNNTRNAKYNRNRNYTDPTLPPRARPYLDFTSAQRKIIDVIASMLSSPDYDPIKGLAKSDIADKAGCDVKTVQVFMKAHLDAAKYEIFQRVLCPELRYHDGQTRREVFTQTFQEGALQDEESLSPWLNNMAHHVVRQRDIAMRPLIAALARTDFGGQSAKTALRKDIGDEWFAAYPAFGSMMNAFGRSAQVRRDEALSKDAFIPLATMLTDGGDLFEMIGWPEDEPPTIVADAVKAIITWILRKPDDKETLEERLAKLSTI